MIGIAEACIEALIERAKVGVARVGRQPVASYPTVHMRLTESAAEFNAIAKAGGKFPMEKWVLY